MNDLPPLSEDEKNRLAKRRERSNEISKLMGNYLLKGYKMLGSTCNKCQTVLLRDRQGEDYCVGCVEVDVPHQPDVLQLNHASSKTKDKSSEATPMVESILELRESCKNSTNVQNDYELLRLASIRSIQQQIEWVNTCLTATNNLHLDARTQYVVFMKTCYETLNLLIKNS